MADDVNKVALTVEVVSSFVGKNHVRPADVPELLASIHAAISALDQPAAPEQQEASAEPEHKPAVTVRKSLASPEHIISMIDGKAYKTLKRHLGRHGLTPDEYRQRYGLKKDYPMVASAYSEARRVTAKALGLGRKAVAKIEEAVGINSGDRSCRSRDADRDLLTACGGVSLGKRGDPHLRQTRSAAPHLLSGGPHSADPLEERAPKPCSELPPHGLLRPMSCRDGRRDAQRKIIAEPSALASTNSVGATRHAAIVICSSRG